MEETEWISAVLSGEHQAFGNLVTRYQGMVYSVCIKNYRRSRVCQGYGSGSLHQSL
ncbi:hypothetical protein ACFTAO_06915 [Paenibacillus rhizoplanae]